VADALEAFGLERAPAPAAETSPVAAALLERLREAPAGANELARATGRTAAELAAALAELELAGLVAQADGVYRGVMS
jgi:predicted Rossmann fold nucleotide-binding protein DprA/Smf involved in DNA uptake